jgi:cell wall-associated NlpC family hydrolase
MSLATSVATLRARMGVTAASIVLIGVGFAAAPSIASAGTIGPAASPKTNFGSATTASEHAQSHAAQVHAARVRRHNVDVHKVLNEARRQRGKPYIYGDAGPHGFDCSGLVRFVFMHSVHRVLPHNAAQQYYALHHIAHRRYLKRGDLVFVDNGGYISHVGIYDGHGYWWVAPHTGTRVKRQRIYHAHLLYARVLVIKHGK